MTVAFLGLGIMGSRMAANLIAAGHSLIVWNRSKSRMTPLLEKGAKGAETPLEAGRRAEVLITMLATPEAVREAAAGPEGFLPGLSPESLWIDSSTVHPSFSREMAAMAAVRKVKFIDAPVSGSKVPAEKGELTILAGGEEEELRRAEPLLRAFGKKIVYTGGVGSGSSMKMVINLMIAHGMAAYAEALHLGEALGFSREKIADVLIGGPAAPPFLTVKREKIEKGDYSPEFPLRLMAKDLHLALRSAYEQGIALPVTGSVRELFALADQLGLGNLDLSAVYRLVSGNIDTGPTDLSGRPRS